MVHTMFVHVNETFILNCLKFVVMWFYWIFWGPQGIACFVYFALKIALDYAFFRRIREKFLGEAWLTAAISGSCLSAFLILGFTIYFSGRLQEGLPADLTKAFCCGILTPMLESLLAICVSHKPINVSFIGACVGVHLVGLCIFGACVTTPYVAIFGNWNHYVPAIPVFCH